VFKGDRQSALAEERYIKRLPIVGGLFTELDNYVNKCLNNLDDIMNKFTEDWWEMWNKLKELTGTSAGFPWLPEYLVFQSTRKLLEKELGIEFKSKPVPNKTLYHFTAEYDSKKIVIGHSVAYYVEEGERMGPRPDVTVRVNDETIAIFEIKVGLDCISALRMCNSLDKLFKRLERPPLVYIVYFGEHLSIKKAEAKRNLKGLFDKGVKFIANSKFWENSKNGIVPENSKSSLKEALEGLATQLKLKDG
jgi:hypothetical protein